MFHHGTIKQILVTLHMYWLFTSSCSMPPCPKTTSSLLVSDSSNLMVLITNLLLINSIFPFKQMYVLLPEVSNSILMHGAHSPLVYINALLATYVCFTAYGDLSWIVLFLDSMPVNHSNARSNGQRVQGQSPALSRMSVRMILFHWSSRASVWW